MEFLKKNWSNILLIVFIALIIIPQTRKPIQIGLNRVFAFSPSEISEDERKILRDYNWNLYTLEGKELNFKQAKGKVVLVNFWATWCPPCIAEMPSFQALYEDYADKVDFYFVSSEKIEKLENFMLKNNYSMPIVRPGSIAPELLRSNMLPTTFVISKNGEIVIDKAGAADWNDSGFRELLDELLREKLIDA